MKQTYHLGGFSLIETILYANLVTVIVAGFFTISYYLITSGQRDINRAANADAARFVTQKAEWMVEGVPADAIMPLAGSSTRLEVARPGAQRLALEQSGPTLRLGRDSDNDGDVDASDQYYPLTNSHIQASGFTVERLTYNGQPAIRIQITLQGPSDTTPLDKTLYIR